jgi:hypothetical protein
MQARGAMPLVKPRLLSLFENNDADVASSSLDYPAQTLYEPAQLWRPQYRAPPLYVPDINTPPVSAPEALNTPAKVKRPHSEHIATRTEKSNVQPSAPPPVTSAGATTTPIAQPPIRPGRNAVPDALIRRAEPLGVLPRRGEQPRRQQKSVQALESPAPLNHSVARKERQPEPPRIAPLSLSPVPAPPAAKAVALPILVPLSPMPVPRNEAAMLKPPAPPPAITITIGRIDIRAAVSPPAAPQTPARGTAIPPQSLADYLKGRARP